MAEHCASFNQDFRKEETMKKYIPILSLLIILASCEKTKSKTQNTAIIHKDTVINLSRFDSQDNIDHLDAAEARETLNDHFKNKGYLIESELNLETFEPESPENYGKKSIDYIDFNVFAFKNKSIGIIRYYCCEPFSNGNCVEPYFAIIANTKSGYKISNEEFLSSHYRIDSIINIEDKPLIFGYDFECANQRILKHYRIALK